METRGGHGAAGFMSPRSVLRGDSLGNQQIPCPAASTGKLWPCTRVFNSSSCPYSLYAFTVYYHYSVRQVRLPPRLAIFFPV
jgi:hypothetical protein